MYLADLNPLFASLQGSQPIIKDVEPQQPVRAQAPPSAKTRPESRVQSKYYVKTYFIKSCSKWCVFVQLKARCHRPVICNL